MSNAIIASNIKRHGNHIRLGPGITAMEGRDGGLLTLTIRREGRVVKKLRGSSLCFGTYLGAEDKKYLASLAS